MRFAPQIGKSIPTIPTSGVSPFEWIYGGTWLMGWPYEPPRTGCRSAPNKANTSAIGAYGIDIKHMCSRGLPI